MNQTIERDRAGTGGPGAPREGTGDRSDSALGVWAWMRSASGALGLLVFWGGMAMAMARYPSEYDWRYMTVSNLLSPRTDHAGYPWATWGIALCGLLGLCWTFGLARNWTRIDAGGGPFGLIALRFGCVCMACSALPTRSPWGVHKGHEILALLAFGSLCLGTAHSTFCLIERRLPRRIRDPIGHRRVCASALAVGAISPILLAGLAQLYVYYVLPGIPWVNLSWRARGVPVYVSFAFWEWMTCGVLSAYLVMLSLAVSMGCRARRAGKTAHTDAETAT